MLLSLVTSRQGLESSATVNLKKNLPEINLRLCQSRAVIILFWNRGVKRTR